jgi:hypothetical protein
VAEIAKLASNIMGNQKANSGNPLYIHGTRHAVSEHKQFIEKRQRALARPQVKLASDK